MTKFKDVAHLYLGCQIYAQFYDESDCTVELTPSFLERIVTGYFSPVPSLCKPILRPLSDMTEEESKEYKRLLHAEYQTQFYLGFVGYERLKVLSTLFLIDKHLDLFDLIKNGEAIDAKTIDSK